MANKTLTATGILKWASNGRSYVYGTNKSKLTPEQIQKGRQALMYAEQAVKMQYTEGRCRGIIIGHKHALAILIPGNYRKNLQTIEEFING